MAFLADALKLVDDTLGTTFAKPAFDAEKARRPLIRGIEKTKTQFTEGKTKAPRRWWDVSNNVVAFSPTLEGQPLQINGKDILYIPTERFVEFLDTVRAAVEAGEFDDELKNGGQGDASVKTPRAARAKKEPGSGSGWSEERRARFAASIEARKKAKGGQ